jgi:hypothetical protein
MKALVLIAMLIASEAHATKPCSGKPSSPPEPCLPSVEQKDEALDLIDKTVKLHRNWLDAREFERKLRNDLRKGKSSDYVKWARSLADVEVARTALDTSFEKTVAVTEKYYRVGPDSRTGKVHGGLFDGDPARWSPVLGTEESYFKVERPKMPPVYLHFRSKETAKEVTLAQLLDDGRVVVSIRALQLAAKSRNPANLAATLEHEGVHFDRMLGADGMVGHAANESAAHQRVLDISDDIGLDEDHRESARTHVARHLGDLDLQAIESVFNGKPYRAEPGSEDYPYVPSPDSHFKGWEEYQKRLDEIKMEQMELRDDLNAVIRGEAPNRGRGIRNGRRQPPANSSVGNGCGEYGFWIGGTFVPPTPCGRELPHSTENSTVITMPALPPAVPVVTLPNPPRPAPGLSGLAERICANPKAAHSQPFHDDYKAGWYASNDEGTSLSKCAGEVFRTLKRIRQEGYSDYNSAYFQSLAENLNMPLPTAFEPPIPEVDLPVPPGPGIPDCLRAEGRRCIRWR